MSESAGLRPVAGTVAEVTAHLDAWLRADDSEPLLIETSGSTGRPKRVALSRAAVLASARATHDRLGGPGRWTLLLPPTYVAGVQVVVRALLAGAAPDDALARHEGRSYVSVVPTQLHRVLDDPQQTALLASYDAVLVGGASLDPDLRERAEGAGVRVVTTYGSSETAGGCAYDGYPLDGVRLRIGGDGRVLVGGATLFDGYDGDPALTAETLVDGWFRTADLGELADDGRLSVLGRVDDVVNTGGVKVPAPVVARRLRAHARVSGAEVVGVEDAEWGQRLVAVVVGDVALAELRDWVAEEHPRAWAPQTLVAVEALPLLGNGKADRVRLRELAGAAS